MKTRNLRVCRDSVGVVQRPSPISVARFVRRHFQWNWLHGEVNAILQLALQWNQQIFQSKIIEKK